jgi:hypothetical protein
MRQNGGIVAKVTSLTADPGVRGGAKKTAFYLSVVLFAVFLGTQIYSPNPRVVKLSIALILFWMTMRSRLPNVVSVLAFILPFSATTALGPTSATAILLVFLIWMARVATGSATANWKTPVSFAIVLFILIHIVSFYNVRDAAVLKIALKKFNIMISCVLLVYLVYNFVRDEEGLRRLVWASSLSCAVIIALSLVELYLPSLKLIPWFTLSGSARDRGSFEARWVQGPFRDGELLGEYMAISVPIQAFMFSRARSMPVKAFWGLMMVTALITALATMHRAPLLAMCLGVVYLIVLFHKRMKVHTLMTLVLVGVLTVGAVEFVMANYTPTGSVFKRIENTEFYGAVPDSRRVPWSQAWERGLEHPWIGHGPHYDKTYSVGKLLSPHSSYLYYFYTIGAIGVGIFIWLLATLIRMTLRYMSPRTGVRTFSTDLLAVIHVQIVVFAIDAIKINFQRNAMYFFLVWLVFGMCTACYRIAGARTAEVLAERRERLSAGAA